jgi:DNA-binding MarR family transcriptional regulator
MGYNFCNELNMCIGPEEVLALDIIYLTPGICQRDLAKKLLKDRAGTGRVLLQLESKGFVERFVDTKGNRLVRKMKLTESGKDMLKLATNKIEPYVKKIKEAFSEEDKNQLKNLLDKFRRILAENVTTQI